MENELEKLEIEYAELKRAVLSENYKNGDSQLYRELCSKLAKIRRDIVWIFSKISNKEN